MSELNDDKIFNELLEIVKLSTNKLFSDKNIGNLIVNTIKEEEFETINDVLDDLNNYNMSLIIKFIKENIINNNKIKYLFNENDSKILYKLLLKIFSEKKKENILNIDILINVFDEM